jgi:hypothetical protein
VLGVRPEDVLLHLDGGGPPDAMLGRVTVVESLGPETIVTLETACGDITTRMRGMEAIDFDVQVAFSFDPARLHLFSTEGGESVLRPAASAAGSRPVRPMAERLSSLVHQAQSSS